MAHFPKLVTIAMAVAIASLGLASWVEARETASMTPFAAAPSLAIDRDFLVDDQTSVLNQLDTITTVGSTVDPMTGDQNPYGLDIAKVNSGKFKAGDLVVCNFNDRANVQGTGTTIIALHPQPGSTPLHVARDRSLLGCTALALAPDDTIWASAFSASDNPILTAGGQLLSTLHGGPWHGPFGQAFSAHSGPFGVAAFYETNASNGSLVRINITQGGAFTFDTIATGFAVNHGKPGSILGPSGLQYDATHDRLYIVDGANNTLVAFSGVSSIPAGGIVVHGKTFSGPSAHRARLVYSGAPLNGPISSALLFDGHLVLGNTGDPTGKNLMIEITPAGRVVAIKNVDTGAGAALFGMTATGQGASTRLYFNDDNDNTVKVLTP